MDRKKIEKTKVLYESLDCFLNNNFRTIKDNSCSEIYNMWSKEGPAVSREEFPRILDAIKAFQYKEGGK